jgi:hypothetical protein
VLGGEHGILDLKDALFGAVAAVGLLILLPDDGKLVEDIGHSITRLQEVALERRQCLRCLALGLAPATMSQGNSGPSDPRSQAKGVKSEAV